MRQGILLIDKPRNKTAFYLVHCLRAITSIRKIGHCGTLDPFATGVMVMLIGRAYTQQSEKWTAEKKKYRATMRLGVATDTYDLDGSITHTSKKIPTIESIHAALLQGEQQQVPPMYSAKKVAGQKLYHLARKGITIPRKPVTIHLHTRLESYHYPHLTLTIECSKGTYIRSIANSIGNALKCYAHLTELVRLSSGAFHLKDCASLSDLTPTTWESYLAPLPLS